MAKVKPTAPKGLARKFHIRKVSRQNTDSANGDVTYYSTSALKGGRLAYEGKIITRNSKTGKVISVKKIDNES